VSPLNEFAKRLRLFITEAGLSQQELCELLDRTKGAVSHWLSGRLLPNYETLVHIAGRLGVSLDWLCGFADAPTWNEQVHRLGMKIAAAVAEVPSNALTTGERVLYVLTVAEHLAPGFVTRRYAAAIAGISPRRSFNGSLTSPASRCAGSGPATPPTWRRRTSPLTSRPSPCSP